MQVEPPEGRPWLTVRAGTLELNQYLIDHWYGEPRNVAVDEHDGIRWFAGADLRPLDLAHPSYIEILRHASIPLG